VVGDTQVPGAVADLLARCHRLGSDPRNTNYAGGNASAKTEVLDPATGEAIRVMYVKGSGGDLGTLTPAGLAALELSRVRGLVGVYRGPEHEDEMVGLFDHCLFGRGAAAPSIDPRCMPRRFAPRRSPPSRFDHRRDGDRWSELTKRASATRCCGSTGGDRDSSSGSTSPPFTRKPRRSDVSWVVTG
jgi:hypothetical protein